MANCEPKGLNLLGITIWSNACQKNLNNEARNERQETRQEERTDRVEARNAPGASGSFVDDAFGFLSGAMESGNATAASIFGNGGAGQVAASAYLTGGTSLLGGLFGGGVDPTTGLPVPTSPLVPLGLGLGALGLVILATRK